jgi:hypothetical protein
VTINAVFAPAFSRMALVAKVVAIRTDLISLEGILPFESNSLPNCLIILRMPVSILFCLQWNYFKSRVRVSVTLAVAR